MENEQTQTPLSPEPVNLRDQLDSLQHLVTSTLVLLIILGGTFCIFLWRQVRATSVDLQFIQPQWTNVMAQYQKNGPIIDDVLKKLQDFGRSNPDFVPILTKYGLKPTAPAAPAAPTRLPGPAAPPGKK
jgi:hypothetical protein